MNLRTIATTLAGALLAGLAFRRRRALRLRGATAVVCGASRGLGRAVALELAKRGVSKIAICARTASDLDALAAELVRRGVRVIAEACDLTSETETERFIENARARLGPIDLLVTNAATITIGEAAAWTKADFEDAHRAIFDTALHPILAATPSMRQRKKGTIAVITSIGGRVGVPHLAPYCAAKFATMGLSESIRGDLAKDGVHVMTVVPGLMRTGSHVHAEMKGDHEREYAWFGLAATAPVLSIDAGRAARRIVAGVSRGAMEVAFTPEARLAPLVRSVAPSFWAEVMSLTSRLLPSAPEQLPRSSERRDGESIERASRSPVVKLVKTRGAPLVRRHAQV